ncbi:MAG: YraN family protein [Oligoflexales bacterium]|nr:YraN family protein [Oligoflexales bacterium]
MITEVSFPMSAVAERMVAGHLSNVGHRILCQNYLGRGFELDIVSILNKTLVLVEVKFRSCHQESINLDALVPSQKKRRLRYGIQSFIEQHKVCFETIRCDLALTCFNISEFRTRKKPYNLYEGIRL